MYSMYAGFGWTAVGVGRCVFRALAVMIFLSFFLSFLSSGWRPGFAHAEFGSVHAPIYSLAVVL